MGKFEGILVCTDLDGTLLKDDKTISQENISAIEYFKQEGGLFTIITGRIPFFVFDICEQVHPNVPFGCINGGGLYDYSKKEYIWKSVMPEELMQVVKFVDETFPDVGIQVNTFSNVIFCKDNLAMENFRKVTKAPNIVCKYDEIQEPVAKVVFGTPSEERIECVRDALSKHALADKFYYVRSEKELFEILPKGSSKGNAISKLCQHLNVDLDKTIALGDYDNDVPMLRLAKVGVAVSNARKALLDVADYVTVSNQEHAIAKVIYDLEAGKIFSL